MDDLELEDKPELNITPLVDIMLVLLAILMVTTPAVIYREDIQLPDGSKSERANLTPLSIRIDKERKIHVGRDTFGYEKFAKNFSKHANKYDKAQSVYIYADKELYYGEVMPIFAIVKQAGFTKVSLGTQ